MCAKFRTVPNYPRLPTIDFIQQFLDAKSCLQRKRAFSGRLLSNLLANIPRNPLILLAAAIASLSNLLTLVIAHPPHPPWSIFPKKKLRVMARELPAG